MFLAYPSQRVTSIFTILLDFLSIAGNKSEMNVIEYY